MSSTAQPPERPILTKVNPHSATELLLEWSSGEAYAVPYAEVRYRCPCAHCVDEMSGQRRITRGEVGAGVKPLKAETVGRYAVKFWWSDRHATGMYPYDTLYDICKEAGQRLQG